MKPLVYSKKESESGDGQGIGWYRDGNNICYFENSLKKKTGGFYHTLSFEMKFSHDDDVVFLAHCYPYTYSDCTAMLDDQVMLSSSSNRVRRTTLCQTIAGNDCEMLIITNYDSKPEEIAVRKAIVITSRVHPGDSNSSFIAEGIIKFLMSDDS